MTDEEVKPGNNYLCTECRSRVCIVQIRANLFAGKKRYWKAHAIKSFQKLNGIIGEELYTSGWGCSIGSINLEELTIEKLLLL